MELFGSLSFGRLLKTLLPGSVGLAGLVCYVEGFARFFSPHPGGVILPLVRTDILAVGVVAVPLSITIGVFLNTCCFAYGYERFVGRPH